MQNYTHIYGYIYNEKNSYQKYVNSVRINNKFVENHIFKNLVKTLMNVIIFMNVIL